MSQQIIILRRDLSDGSYAIQELNPAAYGSQDSFNAAFEEYISMGYKEFSDDKKLKLTWEELEDIVNQRGEERFVEIFDDIPFYHEDNIPSKGETHRDYCEDDGRERRWYIFKDELTGIEYCLNYTYNTEWPNDLDLIDKSIEVVNTPEESDLYVRPAAVEAKEPELTEAQRKDKDIWEQYLEIEDQCRSFGPKEKLGIPKSEIDEVIRFFKTEKFSMFDLRAKMLPICIQYRLEQKSFLAWIQNKKK